jgi:hypothetical protein
LKDRTVKSAAKQKNLPEHSNTVREDFYSDIRLKIKQKL